MAKAQIAVILAVLLAQRFLPEIYIDHGMLWLACAVCFYSIRLIVCNVRPSVALLPAIITLSVVIGANLDSSTIPGDYLSLASLLFFFVSFSCGCWVRPEVMGVVARLAIIANCIGVLWLGGDKAAFYNTTISGFFSVLMACLTGSWIYHVIALYTAWMVGGATSSVCLGTVALVFCLAIKVDRRFGYLMPLATGLVSRLMWAGGDGFYISDRWRMWVSSYRYWRSHYGLTGIGYGRFGSLAGAIQREYGVSTEQIWMSLHNDWLQMLIELGPLFVVFLWLWLDLLWSSWHKNKDHFIAALTLAVFMTVYFPLRIPFFWFVFGYLCFCNLVRRD